MSLIELKKKINSIFTIYKTTKAMRSIALSYHTQFKKKINYIQHILELLILYYQKYSIKNNTPNQISISYNHLHVFIGSEKGLCGAYNQKVKLLYNEQSFNQDDIIILIGKKLEKIKLKNSNMHLFLNRKNDLNSQLLTLGKTYNINKITLHGIKAKNLFVQISFQETICIINNNKYIPTESSSIFLGNNPKQTLQKLYEKIVLLKLDLFLKESMSGEHSMRFSSMESASKNADKNYLEKKKEYFKKRQTKINQELSILV